MSKYKDINFGASINKVLNKTFNKVLNKTFNKVLDTTLNKTLAVLVFSALASIVMAKNVSAMEVNCNIPLAITCEISDPSGFMAVRVNVDFGDLGQIDVVNQSFLTCRTSATVSWDPIVPNFQIFTTSCIPVSGGITGGGPGKNALDHVRYFEIVVDERNKTSAVRAVKPSLKLLKSTDPLRASLEIFRAQSRPTNPGIDELLAWPDEDVLADTTVTCNNSTNICTCVTDTGGDCGKKLEALCGSSISWSDGGVGENC